MKLGAAIAGPVCAVIVALGATGCPNEQTFDLDRAAMMDAENCRDCHPDHVAEWETSMHAYAADDPVFLAMNQRGQEETGGTLGDFCVKCHAPMAVREGLTTDGLNLDQVPKHMKGVTCYFCHNIDAVEEDHNAGVRLANDIKMRGGISNPVKNDAHPSRYSTLHDRNELTSGPTCGSCHDIVTTNGVHLERTFLEWSETLFAKDTPARQTCGHCHMRGRDGLAADYPGVFLRRVHDHKMVGLDVAITDWPGVDDQVAQIQDELDEVLTARVCVNPIGGGVEIVVRLENVAAGHNWPSGAAQDRRAWLEVIAYDGATEVFSSGVVAANERVADVAQADPQMWVLRDTLTDGQGGEVHMFWEAEDYTSELLQGTTTLDPEDPAYYHYKERSWQLLGVTPTRVTTRVLVRNIGYDVLDDLVASGHLDSAHRSSSEFVITNTIVDWQSNVGECEPF